MKIHDECQAQIKDVGDSTASIIAETILKQSSNYKILVW